MEFKLKGGTPGTPQLPASAPMMLMVPGIGLMLLGVLILTNHQLLVYMVAGIFLLLGGLLTLAGFRAKRLLG